jgi:hypothetical protein
MEPLGGLELGLGLGLTLGLGLGLGLGLLLALGLGLGGWPPPHGLPFTVQFCGIPSPVALKPKVCEPPGFTVPFQLTLVNR